MVAAILPLTVTAATVHRKGRRLLGPVDLTLGPGGITVVVGPNGAGKTTLLRLLHGLERRSGGQVRWAVPLSEAHSQQAFVFQSPVMLRRTTLENLTYPLRIHGHDRASALEKAQDWLGRIGMNEQASQPATRLSGGEKQKLALARALIRAPQVLFLDEPCASLDGAAVRDIEQILQGAARTGTRIVMSTHNLGQARRLAQDALFLHHGEILERGPNLLSAPDRAETQAFLNGDILT